MHITEQQKSDIEVLIRNGKKLKAVRYLQKNFNLSADEALTLVEKLADEIPDDQIISNRVVRMSSTKIPRLIGGIFMFIGLIMLTVAVFIFINRNSHIQKSILVEGKVIGFDTHYSDGSTMYTPLFEYSINGSSYQQEGSISSSSPDYDTGELVEIFVDPDNPYDIVVNSFIDRWFVVVILGVMGTVFAGMGSLAFFISKGTVA